MNGARYRLASPPEPIVWRPGFGPRYTLFVDVEEQFDWNAPFERTRHSTSAMAAFPEAHARFREQGAPSAHHVWAVDASSKAPPRVSLKLGGMMQSAAPGAVPVRSWIAYCRSF